MDSSHALREQDQLANVISLTDKISSRRMGSDELNICEFPLCATSRDRSDLSSNTLRFSDKIYDEGAKSYVERELLITASEHFGLPTPADSDVLLVLMYLSHLKNGFKEAELSFTRYELVQLLGWGQSGRSYQRIDEALNRWVTVTLHYKRSWWSRKDLSWQNKAFHVIESFDLMGRSNCGAHIPSTIRWNRTILQSVQSNHVKRLDLETYFQLKSPAARQAYRFLDKRFYRSKSLEFDLRAFACEHVGLSRGYDNGKLKEKLRPCLEELEAVGFLKPSAKEDRFRKIKAGEWKICLSRQLASNSVTDAAPSDSEGSITSRLMECGVSTQVARELTQNFTESVIQSKIDYVEWLSKQPQRAPSNKGAFLVSAIREDYTLPQSFNKTPNVEPAKQKSKVTV